MKRTCFFLIVCAFIGCSKRYVFVLNDKADIKFSYTDSIKKAYKNGAFSKSPLIAIDGIVLKYDKNLDTVVIPLKKTEIYAIQYLHRNVSSIIYGKKGKHGAIVVNTIHLHE
ncbi:hypothetical protein [Flavobacterium magnum]|nr:hypothetical protein [Flavobacterium magnum]